MKRSPGDYRRPGPFRCKCRDYCCGLPLLECICALQAFFMSLLDMLGLLACCCVMQSFICWSCDLLVVVALDDCVVVVVLLLGYAERSDGGAGGEVVCAATTPAAVSASTAKEAATRFIGSSDRWQSLKAWRCRALERISRSTPIAVGAS
jgi:hypothetical protein